MSIEWKPEHDEYLRAAWAANVSQEGMAEKLNTYADDVRKRLRFLLGDPLPQRRKNRKGRPWTEKEERRLRAAYDDGLSVETMAKRFDRDQEPIRNKLCVLLGVSKLENRPGINQIGLNPAKVKAFGQPLGTFGIMRERRRKTG